MIVPISFKSEYQHEYEYLLSKPNRSNFVCKLIRKHIEKETFDQKMFEKNDTAETVSYNEWVDHEPSK